MGMLYIIARNVPSDFFILFFYLFFFYWIFVLFVILSIYFLGGDRLNPAFLILRYKLYIVYCKLYNKITMNLIKMPRLKLNKP